MQNNRYIHTRTHTYVCVCICICSDVVVIVFVVNFVKSVSSNMIVIIVIVTDAIVIFIIIVLVLCIICQYGNTALIGASRNGHKEVVQLLLDHGADKDVQTKVSFIYVVSLMYVCMYVRMVVFMHGK